MSKKTVDNSPNTSAMLKSVSEYYSEKLASHGLTPQGVDWNGINSQTLRFDQLCQVIRHGDGFTLNDLGCGYGALYEYLSSFYTQFSYFGFDVSANMIKAARQSNAGNMNSLFTESSEPQAIADYGIASGIFNVRLDHSDRDWFTYIVDTLDKLAKTSEKAFSCNFLTSYSDEKKKRPALYYSDPTEIFDLCKRRYSRNVALLHDYGLYEFTIIVRKEL
jgi:SAM-dependent methyltransferase